MFVFYINCSEFLSCHIINRIVFCINRFSLLQYISWIIIIDVVDSDRSCFSFICIRIFRSIHYFGLYSWFRIPFSLCMISSVWSWCWNVFQLLRCRCPCSVSILCSQFIFLCNRCFVVGTFECSVYHIVCNRCFILVWCSIFIFIK